MNFKIVPFEHQHISDACCFTDRWIGKNYYSPHELEEILTLSCQGKVNASFVAFRDLDLAGIRLSFLPGKWLENARGISPELWPCSSNQVGYFKSLFIAKSAQKQGLGAELSKRSIEVLKMAGAKAVVCHSWVESPQDSSRRYLKSMGFAELALHPKYWEPIDYLCNRCVPMPCKCTAAEMIKAI